MPFNGLGLSDSLLKSIGELGFEKPTPVQAKAIPLILQGKDIIASAQTGTGKTAAFGLPTLDRLEPGKRIQCLVLEPTRELAQQVVDALESYSKHRKTRVGVVYGGVKYGRQKEMLERGVDILVATPGRLLDHIGQGNISLKNVQVLILDEVDRMLDMGFLPDVSRLIKMCPKERQTLFFSATIPAAIQSMMKWVLNDPEVIEIGRNRSAAETVTHAFYPVVEQQKYDLLIKLLEQTQFESVLIFTRTKLNADLISRRLERLKHSVGVLHSDRAQGERTAALKGFKSGKFEVLVATDIAARGLDIAGVTHVINYDVPLNAEDYVHRIGRTGRAEKEGDAFTLLTEDELKNAGAIEHYVGQKIARKKIENFNYMYSRLFEEEEKNASRKAKSRAYGRLSR
ncbi:MAG TPA: RNA helicase [Opitutae bacterium]|nr:RNA helicase [Opitutae bacterium]|tara:strand:- start:39792 stop:40988 length:1197 start_codon:yes stop_codon:yes gene_type:complete